MNVEANMSLFSMLKNSEQGINPDLLCQEFKHFVHDISCQICLDIAYPSPISCKHCCKIFCKKCIEDWTKRSTKCPFDHPYEEAALNQLSKNMLNLIKMKCCNASCTKEIYYGDYLKHINCDCDFLQAKCDGCGLVGNKNIISMHVNLCEYFDKNCPHCNEKVKIKNMDLHLKSCEERMVQCELCQKTFKASLVSSHINICDEKEIECKYCRNKFKIKNESLHNKEECFKELMNTIRRLSDNYNDTKDANEMYLKKIEKLEADKKKLDSKIATLEKENESVLKENKLLALNVGEYKKGYEEWKAYGEKIQKENNLLKQQSHSNPIKNIFNSYAGGSSSNTSNANRNQYPNNNFNTYDSKGKSQTDSERMFNLFYSGKK